MRLETSGLAALLGAAWAAARMAVRMAAQTATWTSAQTAAGAVALTVALAGCVSLSPNVELQIAESATTAEFLDAELPSIIGPPRFAARDNSVTLRAGTATNNAPPSATIAADVAASAAAQATHAQLLPSGWEPWVLHPSKAKTRYRLEKLDSGMAMRADADSSASGLVCALKIDPARRPFLEWRWRVDSLITGADNTDRYAEDAPVRIVLAFDGDKSALPLRDRLFLEQSRIFSGNELPYATLMYIWENNKPVGSVIQNPHTGRVRKIVVASGPIGVRQWQSFRRNIIEDFKLAYGHAPGKLLGVAILTDTDNTKEKVTAWYGDIKLLRK
jgi:Protein of unknown function (DUF3047)